MNKFIEPEIKVVKFNTSDVLTLSADESYEGVKDDKYTNGDGFIVDFFTM